MQNQSTKCAYVFDEKGGVLAHACHPDLMDSRQRSILIKVKFGRIQMKTSLHILKVFVNSVKFVKSGRNIASWRKSFSYVNYRNGRIQLSNDDILDIYNVDSKSQNVTPTLRPPLYPPEIENGINVNQIDLCHLENTKLLIVSKRFIWLWKVTTNNMMYSNRVIITDWLTFLPKNISEFIAVYQRPQVKQ